MHVYVRVYWECMRLCVCVSECAVGPTQGTTKQHLVSHEKLEAHREACLCVRVLSPSIFLLSLPPTPTTLPNK